METANAGEEHSPPDSHILKIPNEAAPDIDPPMQLGDRVIVERQIENIRHLVAAQPDILENIIIKVVNLLEHPPLHPVAKVATQVPKQRAIEFLIGLVESIFTHGKILLLRENTYFPVGCPGSAGLFVTLMSEICRFALD
jgi:hypothetical protein